MNTQEILAIGDFAGWLLDKKEGQPVYEETLQAWLGEFVSLGSKQPHVDDHMVDKFAFDAKAKMMRNRNKGRGGWENRKETPVATLVDMMLEHVEKGDPMDVALFAMMLVMRDDRIPALDVDEVKHKSAALMVETGQASVRVVKFSDYLRLRTALKALAAQAKKAHSSIFEQCCSNPITNAWGKEVSALELNNLSEMANKYLK